MRPGGRPSKILRRYAQALTSVQRGIAPEPVDVPCRSCSACCRCGFEIRLHESESGEGLSFTEKDGRRVLNKNADGSCIHLTDQGCSVHERRPWVCQVYDCRLYAIGGVKGKEGSDRPRPELNEVALSWRFDIADKVDLDAAFAMRFVTHGLVRESGDDIDTASMTAALVYQNFVEESRGILKRMDPDVRRKTIKALSDPSYAETLTNEKGKVA